jgi:hypothetical protein
LLESAFGSIVWLQGLHLYLPVTVATPSHACWFSNCVIMHMSFVSQASELFKKTDSWDSIFWNQYRDRYSDDVRLSGVVSTSII